MTDFNIRDISIKVSLKNIITLVSAKGAIQESYNNLAASKAGSIITENLDWGMGGIELKHPHKDRAVNKEILAWTYNYMNQFMGEVSNVLKSKEVSAASELRTQAIYKKYGLTSAGTGAGDLSNSQIKDLAKDLAADVRMTIEDSLKNDSTAQKIVGAGNNLLKKLVNDGLAVRVKEGTVIPSFTKDDVRKILTPILPLVEKVFEEYFKGDYKERAESARSLQETLNKINKTKKNGDIGNEAIEAMNRYLADNGVPQEPSATLPSGLNTGVQSPDSPARGA